MGALAPLTVHRRPRAPTNSAAPAAATQVARAPAAHALKELLRYLARGAKRVGLDDMGQAKAARTGVTNPFGKLGNPIPGVRLPKSIEDAIRQKAHEAGVSMAELIRERIVISEVGRSAVEDAHRKRLDAIEGKGDS